MKYCFPGLLLLLIFVTPVLNSRGMKKLRYAIIIIIIIIIMT